MSIAPAMRASVSPGISPRRCPRGDVRRRVLDEPLDAPDLAAATSGSRARRPSSTGASGSR